MRKRSSRFFVVLLHLAGVSHRIIQRHAGIVGVNPWPVQLETLKLPPSVSASKRSSAWRQRHTTGTTGNPPVDDDSETAVWLQDPVDQTCLGPAGSFSECGDATLWWIQKRTDLPRPRLPDKRSFLLGLLSSPQQQHEVHDGLPTLTGWTFVVGESETLPPKGKRKNRHITMDCLDHRNKAVDVLPCPRRRHLTDVWMLDAHGVIRTFHREKRERWFTRRKKPEKLCVRRNNSTRAVLASCDEETEARKVEFTVVRYKAVAMIPNSAVMDRETKRAKPGGRDLPGDKVTSSGHETSQTHMSEPAMHPELKLPAHLLFSGPRVANSPKVSHASVEILSKSNPILFLGHNTIEKKGSSSPSPLLRSAPGGQPPSAGTMKITRMEKHPYIEAASNGIWTDPQTGLEFFTDLSAYLGENRREQGRHTLMGVGQYRKGYVVKVYGIAYYVSKRDVLADPFFPAFSGMSSEDLRTKPSFYDHLWQMGRQSDSKLGKFDRTILLKINMQLSTETMRSSLQADWKLLTSEAKAILVGSSLEPRPADEDMLRVIQSAENPSRCSCSQAAPPEYDANPDCCARGTELAFTWRKNGNLEVRINGRVMDIFPRPDIAEGIFFDYLRHDDPISPELRDRVVDGFPFLLTPLSHLSNLHTGRPTQGEIKSNNPFIRGMVVPVSSAWHALSSNAGDTVTTLQHHFGDSLDHIKRGFGNFRSTMVNVRIGVPNVQNIGETLDEMKQGLRRLGTLRASIPGFHDAMRSARAAAQEFADDMLMRRENVLSHSPPSLPDVVATLLAGDTSTQDAQIAQRHQMVAPYHSNAVGSAFGYPLLRWNGPPRYSDYYAPDEIGPMTILPSTSPSRALFLALVHLYLLLLFIVSFPGSYSTRTKLILKRGARSQKLSIESVSTATSKKSAPFYTVKAPARLATSRPGGLLASARIMLVSSKNSDEKPSQTSHDLHGPSGSSLKKKSLSYCL